MLTENGDLKLNISPYTGADLVLTEGGSELETGQTLNNAVFLSLWVKGLSKPEDNIPEIEEQGWWGNTEMEEVFISRLWILLRGKIENDTPAKIEEYTLEALNWMLTDIVDEIEVTATRTTAYRIEWTILLIQNKNTTSKVKFLSNWEASLGQSSITTEME